MMRAVGQRLCNCAFDSSNAFISAENPFMAYSVHFKPVKRSHPQYLPIYIISVRTFQALRLGTSKSFALYLSQLPR